MSDMDEWCGRSGGGEARRPSMMLEGCEGYEGARYVGLLSKRVRGGSRGCGWCWCMGESEEEGAAGIDA